jgi:protein-disulfide isomerase
MTETKDPREPFQYNRKIMSGTLSVITLAGALWLGSSALAQTSAAPKPPVTNKKSALDKAVLEAWARHLLVLDAPRITVTISDPKPAPMQGFVEEAVRASLGERSQDFLFYISNDGSKILQGNVWDVGLNPFKKDLDRLKTSFQPSMGTPGAPVVLVEFSDFQCPYCKEEATMLRQNLLSAYPKQVRLYYKEYPLVSIHPWAKPAAIAGRCVFQQAANTFWDYHDWIYAHQADITPENLKEKVMDWAKTAKDIDTSQLSSCIDTKASEAAIDKNIEEAQALDIGGTPTLFVNGRRIPNLVDWPTLRNIIDYEIEYQKTARNAGEDCGCDLTLEVPGAPSSTPVLPLQKKN